VQLKGKNAKAWEMTEERARGVSTRSVYVHEGNRVVRNLSGGERRSSRKKSKKIKALGS